MNLFDGYPTSKFIVKAEEYTISANPIIEIIKTAMAR